MPKDPLRHGALFVLLTTVIRKVPMPTSLPARSVMRQKPNRQACGISYGDLARYLQLLSEYVVLRSTPYDKSLQKSTRWGRCVCKNATRHFKSRIVPTVHFGVHRADFPFSSLVPG